MCPQVATILLPKVRRLSDAELSARNFAVATLREQARYRAEQNSRLPEVDGSSSEEETSDESFAARHAPLLAEERNRFKLAATGAPFYPEDDTLALHVIYTGASFNIAVQLAIV